MAQSSPIPFHSLQNGSLKSVSRTPFPLLLLAAFSLLGIPLLLWITNLRGIGLTPDSVSYIAAARSLIHSKGLLNMPEGNVEVPFTGFGPIYSILLAAFSALWDKDPLQSAPSFQAFIFSLNIFLPAFILFRLTDSLKAALATAFFILTSLVTLEIHAMAMSEGVFMVLNILGLYLLFKYLQDQKRVIFFASTIAICSLAFLSRYAGASTVIAGSLALLFCSRKAWGARILEIFIFGLLGTLPMALWITRNYLIADMPGWFAYPPRLSLFLNLWELFAHLSLWFLPAVYSNKLRFLLLAAFMAFSAWLLSRTCFFASNTNAWRGKWQKARLFTFILVAFSISHVGVHLLSSYVTAHIILDNRHLAPVYVAVVMGAALLMTKFLADDSLRRAERWAALGFLLFLAGLHLPRLYSWGTETREKGLGYAALDWQKSEILQKIRELPSDVPIYTNGFDAVYILTGRNTSPVAHRVAPQNSPSAQRLNNRLGLHPQRFIKMSDDLRNQEGLLVYLDKIYWRKYQPKESELISELDLETVLKVSDGTIYRVRH